MLRMVSPRFIGGESVEEVPPRAYTACLDVAMRTVSYYAAAYDYAVKNIGLDSKRVAGVILVKHSSLDMKLSRR